MEIEIKKGNHRYSVEVTQKKMKRMTLRYRDGKYKLSAPMYLSQQDILKWLNSLDEATWQKLKKSSKVKRNEAFVYIFGKKYMLVYRAIGINQVVMKEDRLHIYGASKDKCLDKYLNEQLTIYITKRLKDFQKQGICTMVPPFKLAKLKSCYGECFYQKKALKFSTFLIHEPQQVIDSIIIHELAHLIYPNHSKDFYNYVYTFDPLYKQSMQYLKQGGAGDDPIDE